MVKSIKVSIFNTKVTDYCAVVSDKTRVKSPGKKSNKLLSALKSVCVKETSAK